MSGGEGAVATRREAWPDLDASVLVTLPSGYTVHLRSELDSETYYVLGDLLVELSETNGPMPPAKPGPGEMEAYIEERRAFEDAHPIRERRAKQRAINREIALIWLVGWDIPPRDAGPHAPPMVINDAAIQMLALPIRQEIDDAIGVHQDPYIAEVVQLFARAPRGKATAAQTGRGATSSSASASARTRRPTSSRAGRSAGTP